MFVKRVAGASSGCPDSSGGAARPQWRVQIGTASIKQKLGSRSGAALNAGIGTGISKRKLPANRLRKPAGTGPTSAAGKARSAQNARKHGLNVAVTHDPDVGADVAFMAEEIAPGCPPTPS
jgi:hypothetical protein